MCAIVIPNCTHRYVYANIERERKNNKKNIERGRDRERERERARDRGRDPETESYYCHERDIESILRQDMK